MYVTLAQLKTYIPGISGTAVDALLADCIARAQAAIDRHCERTFEAEADSVRRFDAVADVAGLLLYLDADLCQVEQVTNGDATTIAPAAYVTEPRNTTPIYALRLKSSAGLAWAYADDPEDAIAITGRWAYSLTAPEDIQQACLRLAAYFYKQRDAQVFDVTADLGNGQMMIPKGMPADVKQLLAPYRRLA